MDSSLNISQSELITTGEKRENLIKITIENIYEDIIRISIDKDYLKKEFMDYVEFLTKKENYLITAIRNLIKKTNFLELYQQYLGNQISENEFHDEIERSQIKYIIEIKALEDPNDIKIISGIIQKIDFDLRDFSINEISELFSVDSSYLSKSMKTLNKK